MKPLRKLGKQSEPAEKIFHIRLRNTTEKIDLNDPYFLKILEQEYATKYLEEIGIEPTSKNILNIIRRYPLKNCQLQESRMNGGLHTDTITIIAHRKQTQGEHRSGNLSSQINEQMIQSINLKKVRTDLFLEQQKQRRTVLSVPAAKNRTPTQETHKQQKNHVNFNFDLETIKTKYIFPFNQTYFRKKNNALKQNNDFVTSIDSGNKKVIFESRIFGFPFTQIKVPVQALKQLQTPIKASMGEIGLYLDEFCTQFPKHIIPLKVLRNTHQKSPDQQDKKKVKHVQSHSHNPKSHVAFSNDEIEKVFALLRTEQMSRLVGVFAHFAYWLVFGNVNPVQIEPGIKNQMFLTMFEIIEFFSIKIEDVKLWVGWCMPMLLLSLKMVCEKLYIMMYPQFFQSSIFQENSAGNIALDKMMYLLDNLFDQTNLNGRFTFLESSFNQKQSNTFNDRRSIRKRIFGTSPILDFILPQPKDGKARSILAKKHQIQYRQGILDLQKNTQRQLPTLVGDQSRKAQNQSIQRECQQKMLNIVLTKLQNKIESKLGKNNIIQLGTTQSPQ